MELLCGCKLFAEANVVYSNLLCEFTYKIFDKRIFTKYVNKLSNVLHILEYFDRNFPFKEIVTDSSAYSHLELISIQNIFQHFRCPITHQNILSFLILKNPIAITFIVFLCSSNVFY